MAVALRHTSKKNFLALLYFIGGKKFWIGLMLEIVDRAYRQNSGFAISRHCKGAKKQIDAHSVQQCAPRAARQYRFCVAVTTPQSAFVLARQMDKQPRRKSSYARSGRCLAPAMNGKHAAHIGPFERRQFFVRCCLRKQYELTAGHKTTELVQQLEHDDLRPPVCPARGKRR